MGQRSTLASAAPALAWPFGLDQHRLPRPTELPKLVVFEHAGAALGPRRTRTWGIVVGTSLGHGPPDNGGSRADCFGYLNSGADLG